jgi:hypothetical protein
MRTKRTLTTVAALVALSALATFGVIRGFNPQADSPIGN